MSDVSDIFAFPLPLSQRPRVDAGLLEPLALAAAAFARLDQALASHPLGPAVLYRTRLEAVRRQAAVDGQAIDAWHFAAVIEGLRLKLDQTLSGAERHVILDAAALALDLHRWLSAPDFDQEGEIQDCSGCRSR